MNNVIDKRIAVLGGTFNPIHNGHLIIAEMIREEFDLNKIIFIPSGKPPHKKADEVSDVEHRYNMVLGAVRGNTRFEVSRVEIERQGYTYTVDTLKELKQLYGANTQLYYLIGADVLFDLLTWRNFEEVFRICEFIVALRPGYEEDDFNRQIQFLSTKYCAKFHTKSLPLIEISSTLIRNKVREGKSIRYLVPEAVERYIIEKGLYLKSGVGN
ncbi:MAG: nicotinate-nucleotide adenylyltransferase [Clostridiaceae bacterium]|nr:nicotinate-nucleotide adenylyltransferase [Clostridiaceae bacterium]